MNSVCQGKDWILLQYYSSSRDDLFSFIFARKKPVIKNSIKSQIKFSLLSSKSLFCNKSIISFRCELNKNTNIKWTDTCVSTYSKYERHGYNFFSDNCNSYEGIIVSNISINSAKKTVTTKENLVEHQTDICSVKQNIRSQLFLISYSKPFIFIYIWTSSKASECS